MNDVQKGAGVLRIEWQRYLDNPSAQGVIFFESARKFPNLESLVHSVFQDKEGYNDYFSWYNTSAQFKKHGLNLPEGSLSYLHSLDIEDAIELDVWERNDVEDGAEYFKRVLVEVLKPLEINLEQFL